MTHTLTDHQSTVACLVNVIELHAGPFFLLVLGRPVNTSKQTNQQTINLMYLINLLINANHWEAVL